MSDKVAKGKKPIQVMRERCGGMSDELKTYYKFQNQIRKALDEVMSRGAITVPELARQTGFETADVMWHVIAMKKYGLVEERELQGDYYTYGLVGKE